jgi:carbon storage regulator
MLVLSRRFGESIVIGDDITITVVEIREDKIRLGITCPNHCPVHRQEVFDAIHRDGFSIPDPVSNPMEIVELNIIDKKLDDGGQVHFTVEGGFSVE